MKFRIPILVAVSSLALSLSASQPDEATLDGIISRGNRAYELSQTSRIKEFADSAKAILTSLDLVEDAHKDYAVSVLKLYGNYHYESAALDSAQYYYDEAKAIIDQNPHTAFKGATKVLMLRELAQLHYRRKDYSKALELMRLVDDEIEYGRQPYEPGDDNWLITKLTYAMCLARTGLFDEALGIADNEIENALNPSGLAFARARRMQGKIRLLADADRTGALAAYREYFKRQKEYALANFSRMDATQRQEYWQTLYPFIADCYLLEDADPGLLYDVALFSKGLLLHISSVSGASSASKKALSSLSSSWRDIQRKLKRDEAAVEFIEYDGKSGRQMMALLIRPCQSPMFVPLASPDSIRAVAGLALNSTDRRDKDRLYADTILQRLVWTTPLLQAMKGAAKLYFAPDGYMHRLAVEYMEPVKDIDVCRLTSTRRLLDSPSNVSLESALLFGAINYDLDKTTSEVSSNDTVAFSNYRGVTFLRLDTRSDEASSVFRLRENPADSLLTASQASESAFRSLAPGYSSILVSTHGDFRQNTQVSTDVKPIFDTDGMSRSVIAFAGVNSHLRAASEPTDRYSDGLLSAKELSELDLSGCRLITLSACQSGLGEITPDGIFGLQRGLKQAGAGAMLLSLWNVSSEATARLMREFYDNLDKGKPLRQAFADARHTLSSSHEGEYSETTVFDAATMATRKIRKRQASYDSPQYYDAFILIDAL